MSQFSQNFWNETNVLVTGGARDLTKSVKIRVIPT